jgi:hypothetical protein
VLAHDLLARRIALKDGFMQQVMEQSMEQATGESAAATSK